MVFKNQCNPPLIVGRTWTASELHSRTSAFRV